MMSTYPFCSFATRPQSYSDPLCSQRDHPSTDCSVTRRDTTELRMARDAAHFSATVLASSSCLLTFRVSADVAACLNVYVLVSSNVGLSVLP